MSSCRIARPKCFHHAYLRRARLPAGAPVHGPAAKVVFSEAHAGMSVNPACCVHLSGHSAGGTYYMCHSVHQPDCCGGKGGRGSTWSNKIATRCCGTEVAGTNAALMYDCTNVHWSSAKDTESGLGCHVEFIVPRPAWTSFSWLLRECGNPGIQYAVSQPRDFVSPSVTSRVAGCRRHRLRCAEHIAQ